MTRKTTRVHEFVAMLGKATMNRARMVLANGKFWSGVLAAASLSRGTALIERPPESTTFGARAIEAFITYPAWGVILLVTAAGIVIGQMHKGLYPVGIVAHCISIFAYGTFTLSLVGAAAFADQSWSNLGLFTTQTILHFACAISMGIEIARFRQEVSVE